MGYLSVTSSVPNIMSVEYYTSFNFIFNFCVAIYHGYDKPSNINLFLEKFVDEAVNLTSNGINIMNLKLICFCSML